MSVGFWECVVSFFDNPFFNVVGGIATFVMIVGFLASVYWVVRGAFPLLIRMGIGLSKRKIAIFATNECENLIELVQQSKLFNSKNIITINVENISKAQHEGATIYLVCWYDFKDVMDRVLAEKKHSTALIVYVPNKHGSIESSLLERINEEPNSVIVRFRGRLLNDILTSVLTTSFEK